MKNEIFPMEVKEVKEVKKVNIYLVVIIAMVIILGGFAYYTISQLSRINKLINLETKSGVKLTTTDLVITHDNYLRQVISAGLLPPVDETGKLIK